jgi:heme-degrading monooxygenase HmoA
MDYGFQISRVNAIADADPGFVWRLRSEGADDATSIRAFEDERILITLTVWKSLEALKSGPETRATSSFSAENLMKI